jgi:hypothetical protein
VWAIWPDIQEGEGSYTKLCIRPVRGSMTDMYTSEDCTQSMSIHKEMRTDVTETKTGTETENRLEGELDDGTLLTTELRGG